MSISEEILIDETCKGDIRSFAALVELYKAKIYNVIFRIIRDTEDADEVCQDVFLSVYKNIDKFNKESKFSTWLYRIAYNLSINKLKSNHRQLTKVGLEEYRAFVIDPSENASDDNEEYEILNTTINTLGETDRSIIMLYYYDDMSVKEIAYIIGISEQNVKVKLHRCRAKMYELLKDKINRKSVPEYEK